MKEFMLDSVQSKNEHGNHTILVTSWKSACEPLRLPVTLQLHASAHRQVITCKGTQAQILTMHYLIL